MTANKTFRYDLASLHEPRIVLITDLEGKRSELPRLGYVVIPRRKREPIVEPDHVSAIHDRESTRNRRIDRALSAKLNSLDDECAQIIAAIDNPSWAAIDWIESEWSRRRIHAHLRADALRARWQARVAAAE